MVSNDDFPMAIFVHSSFVDDATHEMNAIDPPSIDFLAIFYFISLVMITRLETGPRTT